MTKKIERRTTKVDVVDNNNNKNNEKKIYLKKKSYDRIYNAKS